jgi:hypothetical protein
MVALRQELSTVRRDGHASDVTVGGIGASMIELDDDVAAQGDDRGEAGTGDELILHDLPPR